MRNGISELGDTLTAAPSVLAGSGSWEDKQVGPLQGRGQAHVSLDTQL